MKTTLKNTLKTGLVALSLTIAISQTALAGGYGKAQTQNISGALTTEQSEVLSFMREEEKLARDVYDNLYTLWGLPVFDKISDSEQKHTDKVLELLNRYGITDPVTDDSTGVHQQQELTDLYYQLMLLGQSSKLDALYVGALVEETDIVDLRQAIANTTQPDILRVYDNLLQASYQHFRSFVSQIVAQNGTGIYQAQALTQQEVDQILSTSSEKGQKGGGSKQGGKQKGKQGGRNMVGSRG